MKRYLKNASKLILGLFVIVVIFILGSYWYVTTAWKKYYSKNEIKTFVKEINKAPRLTDNFYEIYDKTHNKDRHKSMTLIYTSAIWHDIIMNNPKLQTAWHERAASFFPKKKGMKDYSEFKLAWGLEKLATPEKCFDFVINKENKQLQKFDSTLKDVTQIRDTNEILTYLIMMESPSLYRRNSERFRERLQELKSCLKE